MLTRLVLAPLLLATVAAAEPARSAGFELEKWRHASGVEVYYYPTPELPIIDFSIILDAGNSRDPQGKKGTGSLTANLLLSGTKSMDENRFAEELALTGADIDAGSDRDKMVISLRTLSDAAPRDAALSLFADMVRNPAFPEEALQRERANSIAHLKQSLTEPGALATRNFRALLFAGHPYGELVTEESLRAITREDIAGNYRESFVLSRMKLAFVGDISREEADRIADRITAGLAEGEPGPPLGDPEMAPDGQSREIKHPSAQNHIMIGHIGLKRDDPDYFRLHLGAEVLGGGMASRLFDEVREKRGLAYSVYSYFSPTRSRGEFLMGAQTAGERSEETVRIMREVLEQFIEEGPNNEELRRAKESWDKGFALRLDSNRKIMGYVEVIAFYGLPLNYPEYARTKVDAITPDEVREAFRRRIRTDKLSQVVVGS